MSTKPLSLTNAQLVEFVTDLNDLNYTDDEINVEIDTHGITAEQVGKVFNLFLAEFDNSIPRRTIIMALAKFVYLNGLHDSLPDALKIGAFTFGKVRTAQIKSKCSKQNILRALARTLHLFHQANAKAEYGNKFKESAERFGVDLKEIPEEYRFFGANFLETLQGKERRAYDEAREAIFTASANRVNEETKLGFSQEPLTQREVADRNKRILDQRKRNNKI